ncbi:hypothetical protein QWY86_04950 [Pedobacter aquatilis]|uniref:hypothetical protein n=1 Tax=Pedobacter aquatilis TaxID=351343 RepID=UPI0025B59A60|nr:hypothetical protein [Pedobacter aquatilis]MDN3586003.1 hypothetical protein [Pedobacter aquatilis]
MESTLSNTIKKYIYIWQTFTDRKNALRYFGGIPEAIFSNELGASITRESRYEAVLNDEFFSVCGTL